MIYREFAIPVEASGAALCAWRFAVEDHEPAVIEHAIVPDGTVSVTIAAGPDGSVHPGITGPSRRAVVIPVMRDWVYAGLRLRPGIAPALLGIAAEALVDRVTPCETDDDAVRAIVTALSALARDEARWPVMSEPLGVALAGRCCPDRAVSLAADALCTSAGAMPIAEAARLAGLGPRQLHRRFTALTGLAPKSFASVQRLRRAMILSLERSTAGWSDVAHDAGYADQAHLSRDTTKSFARSPRKIAKHIDRIDHNFADRFVQDGRGA